MKLLKSLFRPWFCVFLGLFIAHQFAEKILLFRIELIDNYLDTLLFMPLFLHGILHERKWLWNAPNDYRLPLVDQIIATTIVIIISELVLPILSSSFIYDEIDMICFIAGTIIYNITLTND